MAQSGFTPILIYASGTATNVPTAGNLTNSINGSELAINYADGKLYFKNSSGVVTLLASSSALYQPSSGNNIPYYNSAGNISNSIGLEYISGNQQLIVGNPVSSFANAGIQVTGATSGTGNGANILIYNGGNPIIGIANYSSISGGAYDNSPTLYYSNPLKFYTGSATVLTLNTSGGLGFGTSPSYGTSGQVLLSGGSSASPTWGILGVSGGGTGTATPSIVAGTNITVSGTWPNQTINSTSSGGVTSFSGSTTGLTPNTATTGAITLGGTLAVANGGTGVTSSTGTGSNVLSNNPVISSIGSGGVLSASSYITTGGTTSIATAYTASASLSGQTLANGQTYRIQAFGYFSPISSSNVRQVKFTFLWGSFNLMSISSLNVVASNTQVSSWSLDVTLIGTSSTNINYAALLLNKMSSLTTYDVATTGGSAGVVTPASTLTLQVVSTGTATADQISIYSITMERII
jgi:hypothetical protein